MKKNLLLIALVCSFSFSLTGCSPSAHDQQNHDYAQMGMKTP